MYPLQSAIARGHVRSVNSDAARAVPGVLAVLSSDDPPALKADVHAELALLQAREVAYHGQLVAAVVAETLEIAREAASAVQICYDGENPDLRLRADDPGLYTPVKVNPSFPATTSRGDLAAGLNSAHVTVDQT